MATRYLTATRARKPGEDAYGSGDVQVQVGEDEAGAYRQAGYSVPDAAVAQTQQTTPQAPTPETPAAPVVRYPVAANVNAPKSFQDFTAEQQKYVEPVDEDAIRENVRKQQQARIDAINATYNTMIGEEKVRGEDRLGQTRAISARSGLVGSDFGEANRQKTVDLNRQAENAINEERQLRLSEVFSRIDDLTAGEVKARKEAALGKADAYVKYLEGAQTQARDAVKQAGKAGATLNMLKEQAPEQLQKLLSSTGFSEFELGMFLEGNRPDPIKYDWTKVGNSLIGIGIDPATNKPVKTVYNATELGIPDTANLDFQTMADGIYYYDKDNPKKDAEGNVVLTRAGDVKKEYESGMIGEYQFYADQEKAAGRAPMAFNEYQNLDANRKARASGSGGGGGTGTSNPAVDAWVAQIQNGTAKITNVPAALKNAVVQAMNSSTSGNSRAAELAQQAYDAIVELETAPGKGGAIGFGIQKSIPLIDGPVAGSKAAGYLTQLERVKALLTLPNLQYMKGLGAMSDREFGTISSAVAALSPKMSEKQFNKELTRIKEVMDKARKPTSAAPVDSSSGGVPSQGGAADILSQYGVNP